MATKGPAEGEEGQTLPHPGYWRRDWLCHPPKVKPLVSRRPMPSRKPSPWQSLCCARQMQGTMPTATQPSFPPLHLQATGLFQGCPAKCGQRRVDFILHSFHLPPWFCVAFVTHSSLFSPLTDQALSSNSKIYFFLSPPPNLPPNCISVIVSFYIAFAIQPFLPVSASQTRCVGSGSGDCPCHVCLEGAVWPGLDPWFL